MLLLLDADDGMSSVRRLQFAMYGKRSSLVVIAAAAAAAAVAVAACVDRQTVTDSSDLM